MTSDSSFSQRVLLTLLCVAALAIAPLALSAADAPAAPSVGTVAPNFTLTSQTGARISLNDFRGKWVVLYFYPKDFTSGCTIEAHNFQRDLAQYQAKGAVIVGVSVDTADSHKQFCAKEGLDFKLLSDSSHKVSEMYGSLMHYGTMTLAARHTFILNPKGVIVKEYLKVDPNTHSPEVLAALAELEHGA
ncbi:MAG: peroxiredoxin [Terriglobia bacterium]